jgi:hypothetical protein
VGAVRGCADAGESHACAQLQHALSDEARDVPLDVAHKKTADGPQQRVQPLVRLPLRYTVRCQLVAQGAARRTTHRYTRPFICTARGGGDACMGQPEGVRARMSSSKSTAAGARADMARGRRGTRILSRPARQHAAMPSYNIQQYCT